MASPQTTSIGSRSTWISIVPTILIYDRPSSALEAKFSLPFCAAAAVVFGRVGIDTFDDAALRDPRVAALMPRVTMRVDEAIGQGKPPLTEARVRVRLKDGRSLVQEAHGARGYPANPANADQLAAKFLACASRAIGKPRADALARRVLPTSTTRRHADSTLPWLIGDSAIAGQAAVL